MFAACLRLVVHVILSPRRLLVAVLLATFLYAAFVATKARLFPDASLGAGRRVQAAPARAGGHGVPAPGGTRTE